MKFDKRIFYLGLVLMLTGCSDTWLGEKDNVRLEGNRISVMLYERKIKPEVALKDLNILLPKPEKNLVWSQSGGFSHNAMQHLFAEDSLHRDWKQKIGTGTSKRNRLLSRPVTSENTVFTIDVNAKVSAYEISSGKKLWQKKLFDGKKGSLVLLGSGLSYSKDRLFATTGMGDVFALDAKTGNVLWQKFAGSPVRAAPTYYGGRLFVVTTENKLLALKAQDGSELWSYDVVSEVTNLLGGAAPAVDEGAVVVAFSSGDVVALRVNSGNLLWSDSITSIRRSSAMSNISDIVANPVLDRGVVYVVGNNNLLAAIDLRTGMRLWDREIGSINQPWVAGNYLFVISNENELIALNKEEGKVLWVSLLDVWEDAKDQEGKITWTGPVLVSDRLLVVGSHGKVLAVSPYNGSTIGYEKLPSGSSISPIVANGNVFFVTDKANLIKFK